jgi:hypothetical protein
MCLRARIGGDSSMLNRLIAAYFVEVRVSRKEGHNRQLPDKTKFSFGSGIRARCPAGSGLDTGGKATFAPQRRQSAGLRAFKRTELSGRFVPQIDILDL